MTTEWSVIDSLEPIQPVACFNTRNDYGIDRSKHSRPSQGNQIPDFVGSLENIKQLVRLIDCDGFLDRPSGLTIHKLGDTILLDRSVDGERVEGSMEDDMSLDDALLLLPSSVVEEIYEEGRLVRASGVKEISVKNTFIHIGAGEGGLREEEILRHHSAPPLGRDEVGGDQSRLQVSSLPNIIKRSMMTELVKQGVERSIQSVLPFSEDGQRSPLSRVSRAVEWNIAGFSVLLGCDIVVMEFLNSNRLSDYSSVKNLDDPLKPCPSRLEAREAWLENSLLQLNEVAWVNKERKSVDLVTSTSELSYQADVNAMLYSIKRVLLFLHEHCKGQGNTFCLVRGDGDTCLLYDVTGLPKDCDVLQVSPDLAGPIAKVSYALSSDKSFKASDLERKNLLQKAFRLLASHEDSELRALVAIDLSGITDSNEERLEILLSTVSSLNLEKSSVSETFEKLLVVAVSVLIESPRDLPHALLAHTLLNLISVERKSLECRHLVTRVDFLLGNGLVFTNDVIIPSTGDEGENNLISSLLLRLKPPPLPETRKERLEYAIHLLADSPDFETRGVAHNELANELFTDVKLDRDSSLILVFEQLLASLSHFSKIADDITKNTKRLLPAVFMNLSKAFKILSLRGPNEIMSLPRLKNRIRAITFAKAACKVSKTLPESIVGTELYNLGSELIDCVHLKDISHAQPYQELETISQDVHAAITSSSLQKFFDPPKRITHNLHLGDLELSELGSISISTVARGCFDLSLIFKDDSDRGSRRAEVDYAIARLIAESNENGSDALRHVNRSLQYWKFEGDDNWIEKSTLLKIAIIYKLGDLRGSMHAACEALDTSPIRACMQSICMAEIKNGENSNLAKKILEGLIRKKGIDELKDIINSI